MGITYFYAFVVGLTMSFLVLIGCAAGKRSLVLTGMIFSAIVGSPVITFTRGAAGAIYASDMVSVVLLMCLWMPGTKSFFCEITPRWYKPFFRLMALALFSVIVIGPLFSGGISGLGLAENVAASTGGIPLPILMAGFRTIRIILYLAYFIYIARMIMDEKAFRLICQLISMAVVILAVCQILNFLGVAELGLASLEVQDQHAYIIGHSKAAAGRLYLLSIFATLILLYKRWSAPIHLASIAVIGTGLLFSGSRAAFVGMMAGFVLLALQAKILGKLLALMLGGLTILGFYLLIQLDPEQVRIQSFMLLAEEPSTNPRWIIWSWIIPYIATHPLVWITGVGFSNFKYALVAVAAESSGLAVEHAHNDFLTCLTEMGFLGLVLFVSYLYHLGKSIFVRIRHTFDEERWQAICVGVVFAAYLVSSLFESTMYFGVSTISMQRIMIILFGAVTSLWVQQEYSEQTAEDTDLMSEDEADAVQQTYS